MRDFAVYIFPERTDLPLFGHMFSVSHTVLASWCILAAALALALAFRIFCVPRLRLKPRGLQLMLESAMEGLDNYIGSKLPGMSLSFGAYIFSLALLLVCSAAAELLGLVPPTADITMTFSIALITFVLFNYYGFKRLGLAGRMKHFLNPFNIVSDLMAPLSLSTRLFGNMFGGMIIMDLLYFAMKRFAIGIPSVMGLYFNLFHPLIQAFIFVTLTLSYISEAASIET